MPSIAAMRKKAMQDKKEREKKGLLDPFSQAFLEEDIVPSTQHNENLVEIKTKESRDLVCLIGSDSSRHKVPRTVACHSSLLFSVFGEEATDDSDGEHDEAEFPVPYEGPVVAECLNFMHAEHAEVCHPGACSCMGENFKQWKHDVNFFFKIQDKALLFPIAACACHLDIQSLLISTGRMIAEEIESRVEGFETLPTPVIYQAGSSLHNRFTIY